MNARFGFLERLQQFSQLFRSGEDEIGLSFQKSCGSKGSAPVFVTLVRYD
jgi:hypothetical protein